MNEVRTGMAKHAALAVRVAAVWLLTGALFKLFAGTPKLLPPLVRDHSPFSWDLTFHIAIAIELSIVSVAVLKPHLGWPLISSLFAFFLVVLTDQEVRGADSCGCLGDSIKVPPLVMMSIDGTLLAWMLVSRPWKSLSAPGLSTALLALAVAASTAAPWLVIRTSDALPSGTNSGPGASRSSPTVNVRYINMTPTRWVGKSIYDVEEFTKWVPADKIPTDGRIVMWRQSCDHCAKHLREMANEKNESQMILLVQVMDELDKSRSVDAMPSGANVSLATLPEGVQGSFETPVEIRVEGGIVQRVLYEADFEPAKPN